MLNCGSAPRSRVYTVSTGTVFAAIWGEYRHLHDYRTSGHAQEQRQAKPTMGIFIRLVGLPNRRRILLMLAIRNTGNQLRAGRAPAGSARAFPFPALCLAGHSRRQLLANAAIAEHVEAVLIPFAGQGRSRRRA